MNTLDIEKHLKNNLVENSIIENIKLVDNGFSDSIKEIIITMDDNVKTQFHIIADDNKLYVRLSHNEMKPTRVTYLDSYIPF